jgi:hypothetical protein
MRRLQEATQSTGSKSSCANLGNDVPGRTSDGISANKIHGGQTICETLERKRELTSHCICANRSFPHFGLAHFGVALAFFDRPVMTEQSTARWRSILTLGFSPGGMGTGSLQRGPEYNEGWTRRQEKIRGRYTQSGATRLYLASSYFGQLCEAGLKCSAQKESAQCWHLKGKKSTRWHIGCEHWRPTSNIC